MQVIDKSIYFLLNCNGQGTIDSVEKKHGEKENPWVIKYKKCGKSPKKD